MCKIFDWVFDSVSVEQAPQNNFEDPNQFNQNEDEAHDTIFDFSDARGLEHPANPVETPRATLEFVVFEDYLPNLLSYTSFLSRPLQNYFVSFIFLNIQFNLIGLF